MEKPLLFNAVKPFLRIYNFSNNHFFVKKNGEIAFIIFLYLSLYSPIVEQFFRLPLFTEVVFVQLLISSFFVLQINKINVKIFFIFLYFIVILILNFNYISLYKVLSIIYSILFFYFSYFFLEKNFFYSYLKKINFLISLLILSFILFLEFNGSNLNIDTPGIFIFSILICVSIIHSFNEEKQTAIDHFLIFFLLFLGQIKIILLLIFIILFIFLRKINFKKLLFFLLFLFFSFFIGKTTNDLKLLNVNSYFTYFYSKSNQIFYGDRYNIGLIDIKNHLLKNDNIFQRKIEDEKFNKRGSINFRISKWNESIHEFKNSKNKFFGKNFSKTLRYRHNFILDVINELGIFALSVVLFILLKFFFNFIKIFLLHKKNIYKHKLTAGYTVILMVGIHCLSLPFYNFKYLAFFLGIFFMEKKYNSI